ncbi:uncharacterized protein LOC105392512 [Plutella xylostella]|uniref:uncharacterized protein LOC105392512 n=1 Tax=Plutella xylostella TaxID=51655 RepID=UPI0020321BD9|nr:uncharacterized protein LOC105392512 [Plutella xylostella]
MCAPATAALLLAALTTLPCQGTDTVNTAGIFEDSQNTSQSETSPTINKVYEMLHTDLINSSQSALSNHSNLNLNLENSQSNPCCLHNNVYNKSSDGAKYVVNRYVTLDKKKVKRRRAVSVVRAGQGEGNSTEGSVAVSPPPPVRKKPGDSGSSAPLLNYIFDTYSNTHTHQHRNGRQGTGNSIYAAAAAEVRALVGTTAHLDCKVDALHDKLVSWVRRKSDEEPMELLTTGTQQYTADDRYSARFIPPDIWRLEVRNVRPSDGANYDCQLSAHPPRTARVALFVPEVSVRIVDGLGAAVAEQVCEEGSTVALRCEVRGLRMEGGPALLWYRRDDLLNDDTTRGGISVRTEFGENGAESVLRVARVRAADAGRYTCRVQHRPPVPLPPAAVVLHVIKGESLAELHQGGATVALDANLLAANLLVALIMLGAMWT